jgi:hypothetical protein
MSCHDGSTAIDSFAGNIGAQGLHDTAAALESCGRESKLEKASALLPAIEGEVAATNRVLRDFIARAGPQAVA